MVLPPNTAKRADREPSVSRLIIGPSSHLTCLSVSTPTFKETMSQTLYMDHLVNPKDYMG